MPAPTLNSQTVTSATAATLNITATAAGTYTVTDPSTGKTATLVVQPTVRGPFGGLPPIFMKAG